MHTISSILTGDKVIANRAVVMAILVVSFVAMTALGAYVRIPLPFSPVPITLQTFFVLLCGAVLGRKFGALAQASYVGLGVLGIPLFQGYGAGLLHLAGPTGGYLVGFIAASFLVGNLIKRNIVFAMSLGLLVIYVCGISWLMVGYKLDFVKAVYLGFIPFIPGAACKLIAASWIYSKIRTRCEQLPR
ncbi:MAG: biotin transporter BioY [Candidatus Omnitrophota bacterium]